MHTYISTKEELESTIAKAVEQAVSKRLPEVILKVTRKPIYNIDEACELLNVSRRHLQYLRDSQQLPYIQNGRKIYFRAEDLDKFFNANYIKSEVQNG